MSETVTITKEELRRAVVAAWTDCVPAYHMDLDEAWEALKTGVPDDTFGPLRRYDLSSLDCWGSK